MRRCLTISAAAVAILLGPGVGEAHAYIDPGTGSSLFASLGVMLGIMTALLAVGLTQVKRFGAWFMFKLSPSRKDKPLRPD